MNQIPQFEKIEAVFFKNEQIIVIVILTLSAPTPKNGQAHSDYSSATADV